MQIICITVQKRDKPMKYARLETYPSLDDIEQFRELETKTIYIKSPIMREMAGLLIESAWKVDYSNKSIHLLNSNLVSHYEKVPLTPFDIPDRHLRFARKIGAVLFKVKRFTGLVLFEMNDQSIGYSVTRDDETRLFTNHIDANLYSLQRTEEGDIGTQTLTKETTQQAQRNSAEIRTEVLRLMTQAMTGVGAIKRIKTLKNRGVNPAELENIWCDAHDRDHIPAVLRSILYE
jgi:hypothetical protein